MLLRPHRKTRHIATCEPDELAVNMICSAAIGHQLVASWNVRWARNADAREPLVIGHQHKSLGWHTPEPPPCGSLATASYKG